MRQNPKVGFYDSFARQKKYTFYLVDEITATV